jgi:hypothetical protein
VTVCEVAAIAEASGQADVVSPAATTALGRQWAARADDRRAVLGRNALELGAPTSPLRRASLPPAVPVRPARARHPKRQAQGARRPLVLVLVLASGLSTATLAQFKVTGTSP